MIKKTFFLFFYFYSIFSFAHHSKALQFDLTKEIAITGSIAEMEWRNPHAWLHLNVTSDEGEDQIWKVEFGAANSLYRRGWRPDDLPLGSTIIVHGLPSRDGSRTIDGEEVTLEDGKTLFSGNAED
ncbi:MAG: hypothetical protein CBC38_06175 [Gammaproteobacteria bacterium TMED78]|nr:MAG: hypothetical protein CBC38_06175 [Gammaproteobacteria bacterium TMED78]|tara:strand:+ start:1005 stop:1382 length:378 start_codon:yes stop_codon:yes gene_type:complete